MFIQLHIAPRICLTLANIEKTVELIIEAIAK